MLYLYRVVQFVLIASAFPCVCQAQGGSGLTGTVEDPTGAIVPSAKITLINKQTTNAQSTLADEEGQFLFRSVAAGAYSLRAESEGFRESAMSVLITDKPLNVKIKLRIAAEENVTVNTTGSDPLAADSNANAVRLNDNFLRALPTEGQDLQPVLDRFISPAAAGTTGVSVILDGLEADQLDDIPSSSIKRITIDKNPYAAEFRRPGKARVEITTKSGSPRLFHGGIALFARNSTLDAGNPLASTKPDLMRWFWDASFSGPAAIKKTSFFLSTQRLSSNENAIINAETLNGRLVANVPTALYRTNWLGRLDFHPSAAHSFFVQYLFDKRRESNQGIGGVYLPSQGVGTQQYANKVQFTDQVALSPTFLNRFLLAARRQVTEIGSTPSTPSLVVNGAFVGGYAQTARAEQQNMVEIGDTVYRTRGIHTIELGGTERMRFVRGNDWSNFGGTFEFSDLGHFAKGNPYVFRINQGVPHVAFQMHETSGFVQDNIRLRPDFNLVLGLRYDWQSNLGRRNEFAPRLAFAYSPGEHSTIIRGGAGVFYEQLPEVAVWRTALFENLRQSQLVIPNPGFPNPIVPRGASVPPSIFRLTHNISAPYLLHASFAIERQLSNKGQLTVEAYTIRGVHLFRARDVNAPLPSTGVRPMAGLLNLDEIQSTASSRSTGVSVSFKGKIGKRVYMIAQYDLSRTTDDTGGIFSLPADNYNLLAERGPAGFDRRHRFALTGTANLPGSFRLGTLLTLSTGVPFDITNGFDTNHDTVANDRPRGITRNTGRGSGFAQLDFRFTKLFRLPRLLSREGAANNAEINLDVFNALNQANFRSFIGVVSSPLFGEPSAAYPGRTIQLSVRYRF
jgi:hypothetical protein